MTSPEYFPPLHVQKMMERIQNSEPTDMETNYAPTPWSRLASLGTFGDIVDANGEPVAQVQPLSPTIERDIVKRNQHRNDLAEHIVLCVNSHELLVKALRDVEAHHAKQNQMRGRDESRSFTLRTVRAAIQKATQPA